jgi:hypothetical protein
MIGYRAPLGAPRHHGATTTDPLSAHDRARAEYVANRPFFTMNGFRAVVQAFDEARYQPPGTCTVPVTGVDGVTVHFHLMTGQVYADCGYPGVPKDALVVM